MGYSYYKNPSNVTMEDIKGKWTAWTEEGINNHIIYIYDNDDVSEAKDWKCATVICAPGLQVNYQWSGWNIFALNNILDKINVTRILLDKAKAEEKVESKKLAEEEKKLAEEEKKLALKDEYVDFCTWNYGTKIVDIFHNEDKHFNIAVNKIMESVTLAVEMNCGNIPAVMNILKNMNIALGKSKLDNKKTTNIWKKEKDEDGNDIYLLSEYTLDWKRKTINGYVFNAEVKDVNVDFNMRIFSPKNAKAKESCERILNKCIQGGIISDIFKEVDSLV